ncbi:lysophospholipid acyltransferase family protein [Chitinophaga vietnamensis]|uniref:hypothetical protein n=1 Tax=Chitinophaga vietnamensis TaxID=2593957 RepID=UPI001177B3FB|nr:hypothetical protein [Chitinophaga vietnamensis]
MNHQQLRLEIYEEQRSLLKTYVDKKWDTHDLKNYHFLSANLSKCLPAIGMDQHKAIYHDILSYRVLQSIDTRFYEHFDHIDDFGDFNYEEIKTQLPAIFVSFHLGSFRSALAFLVKYHLDVVLIIDPLPYNTQKDTIIAQYEAMKQSFGSSSDLVIYPADKQDLSVQLLDKIGKQYSVLAFVDGNTGFNGAFNQKKSLKLPFLGQEIAIRKGLAMLAYYAGRPVIPMLSFYDDQLKPRWKVFDPIIPDRTKGADDFSRDCLQKLFAILEGALKQYYAQWEGWIYLHKFMDISVFEQAGIDEPVNDDGRELAVNPNAGFFSFDEHYYILNKENYRILEITAQVFLNLLSGKTDSNTIEAADRTFLLSNGILKNPTRYENN